MNCRSCGAENQETFEACKHCGALLQAAVGNQPYAGPTGSNRKATVSLVCGIVSLFFFPAALLAIVFGHLSLGEIRKSAGSRSDYRNAKTGLTLGYIGVGLLGILLVVCFIMWSVASTGP
jgi:hypothetical protein